MTAAQCAVHADAEAHRTCERCGAFMCRECSARWVEERCPTCRPPYGPSELRERRLGHIRRVQWLRCDVCGLEGPRLDRPVALSVLTFVMTYLGSMLSVGVIGFAVGLAAIAESEPICAGCERVDELEPSLKTDLPRPRGWDEFTAQFRRQRLRNAVLLLGPALLIAAILVFSALR